MEDLSQENYEDYRNSRGNLFGNQSIEQAFRQQMSNFKSSNNDDSIDRIAN
jgi:hypothetical protein